MKLRNILASATVFALAATGTWAQNGAVTSNLKKVLLFLGGYSSDHANTVQYAGHFMALGAANGFTVDTTRSSSVFTSANLANYQALVLFNAYNFGVSLSAAQKDAVRNWYAGNRGLACFHQCTKHDWGASPSWMDNVMGVRYHTWAGFGTGPIYVHADAVGSDLAMSSTGTGYAADFTVSWDDEWYTYQANPDPLPNTKMVWTTKRSAFSFASSFYLAGEVQPMAWAREVEGGRYLMNSLFHRDVPRTSTNPQIRQFVDGAFLGSMRFIAGYTGCKDANYKEYNPKATHQGANACVTPLVSGIRVAEAPRSSGDQAGGIQVSLTQPGPHSVEVFDASGKQVYSRRGAGAATYAFTRIRAGMHYVRVHSAGATVSKRYMLL